MFVLRTIKDGKVKIFGNYFAPDEDASRFNGMRAAFGLYYGPPNYEGHDSNGLNRKFVNLWGSEEQYKAKTEEEYKALWPGPFCVDGYFKWEWWNCLKESA